MVRPSNTLQIQIQKSYGCVMEKLYVFIDIKVGHGKIVCHAYPGAKAISSSSLMTAGRYWFACKTLHWAVRAHYPSIQAPTCPPAHAPTTFHSSEMRFLPHECSGEAGHVQNPCEFDMVSLECQMQLSRISGISKLQSFSRRSRAYWLHHMCRRHGRDHCIGGGHEAHCSRWRVAEAARAWFKTPAQAPLRSACFCCCNIIFAPFRQFWAGTILPENSW